MTKAECIKYVEDHLEVRPATANGAYTCGRTIVPNGDVNHSIGCAQPRADVIYNNMNKTCAGWGVNAILGDFHTGEGKIILSLRFDKATRKCSRNWGVGSGKKGSWNNTRIQWEVCEPAGHTYAGGTMIGYDVEKNQAFFDRMWKMLVAWNVYCATLFGFDPSMIGDHAESYKAGMGGNHSDMGQWLPKHGKSMDALRAEVKSILDAKEAPDMTKQEVEAIVENKLQEQKSKQFYATLADIPKSYRPAVEKVMKLGLIVGYNGGADGDTSTIEDNTILLDETACRLLAVLNRAGVFDKVS